MLALTGWPVVILVSTAALAIPGLLAWRGRATRWRGKALTTLAVLGCQVLAIAAVGLAVNKQYVFYSSWSDLVGREPIHQTTHEDLGAHRGTGTIQWMSVQGQTVLVWLPRQYHQPELAATRFPVVMFLPGQPSKPSIVFKQFEFGAVASRVIDSGQVPPFIAVFPPLMVNPPRDTECTNLPDGPQAQTWLDTTVVQTVQGAYRTAPAGAAWTIMGWSEGGFCSIKVALSTPHRFGSAVSVGGYVQPWETGEVAQVLARDPALQQANSPLALYQHRTGNSPALLLISSKQDPSSWPLTLPLIEASGGAPAVTTLSLDQGGHNYRTYRSLMEQALLWASEQW